MKSILVLTDFSEKAEYAAKMAMQIAARVKAKVQLYTAFHAAQVFPSDAGVYPFFEDYSEEERLINHKLSELAEVLKNSFQGNKKCPKISFSSRPGNLSDNIEGMKPWLIVMGGKSKTSALSHFLFGSNSSAVMEKASCPVLIVPEGAVLTDFKKIVFATDLQPSEKNSLSFLEEFGKAWKAGIMVLHVSDKQLPDDIWDGQYEYYKNIISGSHPSIQYTDVRGTDIAKAINKYVGSQGIDLVAIAHKKRSFIGQLLHKSIGKDMLNYQEVPVLILQTN